MLSPAELAQSLLEAARAAGADQADAIVATSTDVGVSVREGALEEAESAESVDYGLRVLIGQRQACVSSSDPSPEVLVELAERAVAMAQVAPDDPWCGLADPADFADLNAAPDLELCDPGEAPSPEKLQQAALAAEAAVLAVEGVAQAESASAGYSRSGIALATSNGFAGDFERTGHSVSASAVAGEGLGMETDYDFSSRIWAEDLADPAEIGTRAGQRAVERLNPRKAKTGAYPVLFDERVSGSLIGHVLGAINGGSVARGSSWAKDKMGERVLPAGFDLIDEPFRVRGGGSRVFDGEGMGLSRRALIADGILLGWLMDTATARQLGLPAPGGARRGIGSPPSPGLSNLSVTEGSTSRADLIRDMGEGLIITSLIGSSVNPTTGSYSRGGSGFWVEGGEIVYAVNELTIAGSLPDFLTRLTAANDADKSKSMIVPSLMVEGLTIASG